MLIAFFGEFSNHKLSAENFSTINHVAENTICSATPEILGYVSTMTQHFFGA